MAEIASGADGAGTGGDSTVGKKKNTLCKTTYDEATQTVKFLFADATEDADKTTREYTAGIYPDKTRARCEVEGAAKRLRNSFAKGEGVTVAECIAAWDVMDAQLRNDVWASEKSLGGAGMYVLVFEKMLNTTNAKAIAVVANLTDAQKRTYSKEPRYLKIQAEIIAARAGEAESNEGAVSELDGLVAAHAGDDAGTDEAS